MEGALSSFDGGYAVCAVLLDLSKASDFVDRKVLLNKLEYYEIKGKIIKLLESYLTEKKTVCRFGRVCINL